MGRPVECLAAAFASLRQLGITHRETYSEILRRAIEANPALLGAWTVWEPNSFDGRDDEFRFAPGHDGTGRFIPYWHRAYGSPKLDPVGGYERPGHGDWYWVPKREAARCHVEDYWYSVGGRLLRIRSEIVPIVETGRCVGVVAIDEPAVPNPRPRRRGAPPLVVRRLNESGPLARLTRREREIHHWLVEGKTNEDIAIILGISAHTVKNHLSHIFEKLGVENRTAAALAAR